MPDADSGGARAHVLGVVEAFERAGWAVDRFIAGDEVDPRVRARVSAAVAGQPGGKAGPLRRLASDVLRLASGVANERRVRHRLTPTTTWAYERFASMQRLGRVARSRGIPWILETQGPFFLEASQDRGTLLLTRLARILEVDAYRRCDALVCVSNALRDIVVDLAGINPAKVLVIPNGVDGVTFDPGRVQARRLTPPSTLTIGYVGGLPAWQALDRLFASVARLRDQLQDVAIVVVGDGSSRASWEEASVGLGVADLVHWVGRVPRDEVPSYVLGFDVGYSGQIRSSLGSMYHSPLKLYEYLAMGIPILASDFDDARRLVNSVGGGTLFDPDMPESLDDALLEVRSRHDEHRADRTLIRERTLAQHGWDQRVSTIIAGVRGILDTRGGP